MFKSGLAIGFVSGVLVTMVGVSLLPALELNFSNDISNRLIGPAAEDQFIVPHRYNCGLCPGNISRVRIAEDFDGERISPSCYLREGDTILIKGVVNSYVIAEVTKRASEFVGDKICKIGQRIVYTEEEWQWFLNAIKEDSETDKLIEEIKRYATR